MFEVFVPWLAAGARYRYRIDGEGPYPDPASRFQPEGVHGPSEVIDPAWFAWTDGGWSGVAAAELVVYELHVGTFSPRWNLRRGHPPPGRAGRARRECDSS